MQCRVCGEPARHASTVKGFVCDAHHRAEQELRDAEEEARATWQQTRSRYERAWKAVARAPDRERAQAKVDALRPDEQAAWHRLEIASYRSHHALFDASDAEIETRIASDAQAHIHAILSD